MRAKRTRSALRALAFRRSRGIRIQILLAPRVRNFSNISPDPIGVVAASVGVASMAGSESTALLNLAIDNVWMPVVIGDPAQPTAYKMNLKGIVLFSLNDLTGSAKLPPLPSSTEPPTGERNPLKQ